LGLFRNDTVNIRCHKERSIVCVTKIIDSLHNLRMFGKEKSVDFLFTTYSTFNCISNVKGKAYLYLELFSKLLYDFRVSLISL
jgi:hypothetical protein